MDRLNDVKTFNAGLSVCSKYHLPSEKEVRINVLVPLLECMNRLVADYPRQGGRLFETLRQEINDYYQNADGDLLTLRNPEELDATVHAVFEHIVLPARRIPG